MQEAAYALSVTTTCYAATSAATVATRRTTTCAFYSYLF